MGMELAGNKEGLQFPHFVGLHAYGGCGNAAAVLGDAREVQGFDPGKVASCIQSGRGGQGSRIARTGQVLGFLSGIRSHDRFVVDGEARTVGRKEGEMTCGGRVWRFKYYASHRLEGLDSVCLLSKPATVAGFKSKHTESRLSSRRDA